MRCFIFYLLTGLLLVFSCRENDVLQRQKMALDGRKTELVEEVDQIIQHWVNAMASELPADVKKYPKVRSPLVPWRLAALEYDWRRPLGDVMAQVRNTPLEREFKGLIAFFEVMEKFWKKEVDFRDYMEAYDLLKETPLSSKAHMLADFDHTFVHVEAFYQAQDMEGDDRAIVFFRHWQVAFHFPREKSESVSDYLARLCQHKLSEYCSSVPFEQMHFAMEIPYLQRVEVIVQEYLKDWPDCPLNRVFTPFAKEVSQRLSVLKPFQEDLILPSSRSRELYVGDLFITVSPQMIEYEDNTLTRLTAGYGMAGWKKGAKVFTNLMDSKEKERGPENMELISLRMARDAPIGIAAAIVDAAKGHAPRMISFAARRRQEGISRLTLLGRFYFRELPLASRKITVENESWSCSVIGQSDDSKTLSSEVKNLLILDNKRLRRGTLAGGVAKDIQSLQTEDLPSFIRDMGKEPILFLVASDVSSGKFLATLEPLVMHCVNEQCTQIDKLDSRIELQACHF